MQDAEEKKIADAQRDDQGTMVDKVPSRSEQFPEDLDVGSIRAGTLRVAVAQDNEERKDDHGCEVERRGDQPESDKTEAERLIATPQRRVQVQGEPDVGGDHEELGARAEEDLTVVFGEEGEVVGLLEYGHDAQGAGDHAHQGEDSCSRGGSSVVAADGGATTGVGRHSVARSMRRNSVIRSSFGGREISSERSRNASSSPITRGAVRSSSLPSMVSRALPAASTFRTQSAPEP